MNIRVYLNYPIKDGTEVVFRSPVDCSQVTGLQVYYPENGATASKEFAFADAHGNNVGNIDHLFAENVVVKVILDVTTGMAFVQNADTNAYLEGRLSEAVTHTKQSLTEEQKTQARDNIGAVSGFYNTEREEVGKDHDDINSDYIWGLYDALMAEYPDKVQKNPIYNDDGTFPNYEYVVSTGDYNEVTGSFNAKDDNVKKPKYLVLSGIHGYEKTAVVSTYRLFRDIVTGHNIPAHFREGCVIHFLPVATPYGVDNNTRYNANGVDINRNFDWEWDEDASKNGSPNEGKYPGKSPASEKETQAISNWLQANRDAELFLDCHNMSPGRNEIVTIVGLEDREKYNTWKKIAMRGIDRVVQFWKNVIGYSDDTIFRNSASIDDGGLAVFYASEGLKIPSLGFELSVYPTGNETSKEEMAPETIAVASEAIGNALMEFYNQAFSGGEADMTETNEKIDALAESTSTKLDALLQSSSFRVESGVYTVAEDLSSTTPVQIPCSNDYKVLTFTPDTDTLAKITALNGKTTAQGGRALCIGFVGQKLASLPYTNATNIRYRGYMAMLKPNSDATPKFIASDHATYCDADGDFTFQAPGGLMAGNYNWTAYYWNE